MRSLIRFGRRCPTSLLSLALTAGLLFPVARATRGPAPLAAGQPRVHRLIVNSSAPQPAPGKLTLQGALATAGAIAGDVTIEFDSATFGDAPATLTIASTIVAGDARRGRLRIDGAGVRGGLALDVSDCNDAGLQIGGTAQVTLANLTVRGGRQRSVLVKEQGELRLEKVTIRDAEGPGIAVFGNGSVTFQDGRLFSNRTHGLEMHGQATATLVRVDMRENGQSAVSGFDRASVNLTDCRGDENGEWGLVLTQDSRATLIRTTLLGGRFAGIDLSGTATCRLQDCVIDKSDRFGIFATGRTAADLVSTAVRGHAGRGIELQDSARLVLESARVESNGDYGIILFGQSTITATRSVVASNGAHGASLRGAASGTFTGCVFAGNRYSGLGCLDAQNGGKVQAARCLFQGNGMRPIYRGPMHLDPLVPTPLRIDGTIVDCMADPGASIELFLDRAGEASRYLKTVQADNLGRFGVDCREIPQGWVMTAAATVNGSTSEFNVVGGTTTEPVLEALLARTGPLSDDAGEANPDSLLRRWKPGTHLVLSMDRVPSVAVERYLRFLVARVPDWTSGSVTAELRIGRGETRQGAMVIPIRYLAPESPQLLGRGGVTLMKWDASGYFMTPMEIMLSATEDPQESCPRVVAHEIGHALGLCHTRVGLLSRMQGASPPSAAFVNDFSPILTYYDVLALQILHDDRNMPGATLRRLRERGGIPAAPVPEVAAARVVSVEPAGNPPTEPQATPTPARRP